MAAGDALGTQFWKANPNQMALPGLEEHSHPGAKLLAEGYRFGSHIDTLGNHSLTVTHENSQGLDYPAHTSALRWNTGSHPESETDLKKGEIGGVYTDVVHQKKGIATALYGVGREMARIKPRHSTTRTREGDKFAAASSKKHGGPVPRNAWASFV